jgi:hypothetical protein
LPQLRAAGAPRSHLDEGSVGEWAADRGGLYSLPEL